MELQKYKIASSRTCPDLGSNQLNNLHMLMGLSTEVGELMDVFKRELAYKKPVDWVNVSEEVADIMWYLVNFCRINDISIEQSLANNIAKLKVRFPEKFDAEKAINRDTTKERVELEK